MPQSLFARANGINIHYLREGHGPPLVLLHGWPEFCHVWQPVIAALKDRFELFAPDLRGFGDTTKPYAGPTEEMTSQVLADDLSASPRRWRSVRRRISWLIFGVANVASLSGITARRASSVGLRQSARPPGASTMQGS